MCRQRQLEDAQRQAREEKKEAIKNDWYAKVNVYHYPSPPLMQEVESIALSSWCLSGLTVHISLTKGLEEE